MPIAHMKHSRNETSPFPRNFCWCYSCINDVIASVLRNKDIKIRLVFLMKVFLISYTECIVLGREYYIYFGIKCFYF